MDENNFEKNSGTNQNSWEQPQPQPQQQWEQQPQQNQWQQQGMPQYQQDNSLSVGQWVLTLIIMAIPCVNIIMLFVWSFGNEQEPRKNWARASLIMMAIGIVFSFLFSSLLASVIVGMAG